MASIPSAARHAAALSLHNQATEALGKGFLKGTIKHDGRTYEAAIWSLDPQLPALVTGALDYKERLQFSIAKSSLRVAFADGAIVIYIEMKRAYAIERILDETSDVTSWRFEARRVTGSDPE